MIATLYMKMRTASEMHGDAVVAHAAPDDLAEAAPRRLLLRG